MPQDAIDISQIRVEGLTEKPFPATLGFRIIIREQAHAGIWQHARETLIDGEEVKEVGGVLVGNIYKDSQGPFLEVKAGIVARHTRNEGTEVAFTPETWDQVNMEKDELYPGDLIVGWYHTHPRFGIFLSERDKFIQEHSFSQPWATAFVVDPVQETEGFFFWSDGEPKEAPEYWVGQKRHLNAPSKEERAEGPGEADSAEDRRLALSQASMALAVTLCLLTLLFSFGYGYWREEKRAERDKLLIRALETQQAELDRSFQTLALLTKPPEQSGNQAPTASGSQPDAPPAADSQTGKIAQDLEIGLRRVRRITLFLKAEIAEQQKLRLPGAPAGNPPAQQEEATPTPEATKQ